MNKPITDNYTTIEKMFATDKTLHQHFEEQATKSPENIALIFGDTEISYFNLNRKSNQLAMLIRERFENLTGTPLPPETLIPICMEKGIEMIVAILAILKAGGAYVPIDPAIPQSRIDFIWKDLDAKLIISQSRIPETYTLQLPEQKTVFVDLETPLLKDFDEPFDWSVYSRPEGLAYVIYTSGTTGNPKGVMQTHHNVIRLFKATGTSFQFDAHDVWTFFHSYAFDFSVWEIWGALLYGAKLVVVDKQQTRDMDSFYQLCCAHSVTVLNQTPFAFYRFAEIAAERTDSASLSLRYIIFGGEALNVSLLKQWWTYQRDNALQTKLINMYGITETTVHVTYKEISENEPSISNIGKPISDLTAYILDSDGQPVAADIAGELHIGGAGLATGYLNNPELTAQRFIQNPFASDHDRQMGYTRMYKTGDLARWLPDGNLEYIGRNDDQVKIRGYRIELAEIEHALVQIPGITQAAVMARQRPGSTDSAKYLAAYYVLNPGHSVQRDAEILGSWEDLYDSEYNKNEGEILEADFSGWNSYVTGKPIPLPEMQAWRKDILDTLNSLKPKSILEIGVGSGLLMYPLLETVHQYTGLDISKAVIDRHRKYLENKKHEVRLFHLAADQVDHIPLKESFDTIIINSVCQYFPGIVYFEDVLLKAFEKLSENGTLFLGDVRNYDLHKQLIADKFRYAEKAGTDQDINRISLRENELLLSPAYFNGLQNRFTDMQVTVAERKGSYENELSRYRYDVLISKKTDNKLLHQQTPGSNQVHTQALYNVPFLNQLSDEDILSALRKALPEYMVPAALVQMENFPLTSNGKLDKKAFPDPDMGSDEADYLSPQNETQAAICTIWQEVLGLKRVSIDDDFFRIGGDSILSIQAANRVRQMGFNCGVKDIFSCRTVEKLEKHLRHNRNQVALKSEQGLLSGTFGLLPIQQWFVHCIKKGQLPAFHHWNQSFLIRTDVLDIRQLEQALEALVGHHDMLRARFTVSGTEWQQSYLSDMEIPELKALDVRGLTETQIEQSLSLWQNDFDLTSGPLFRMGYLSGYADGSARVYIALHHMIVDTVSWRILAEDLSTLYKGKKLPQKGSSYRQWVQYMEGYSSRFPNEEIYWNTLIPELTSHPEMEQKAFSASFELDPDTTQRLLQKAPAAYNTQVNDLLMTALAFALKDTDGKDIHTITLEGHGREALDPGIDHGRTLGWFTSLFPVRIKTEASILQTIPAIKEMLRAIPNRGIGYGAFTGHQGKLPPLRFNYLGQFDKPDGNWQITGEGNLLDVHPDNTDDLLIDISAMVTGGKLRFSITTKLGEDYTNQINNHLQQRLKETVHHCIEKIQLEGPGFTPADFPDLQLSQPQLDSLQTAAVKAQNSITHIFPANSLQQGFIYHALTQPGDDAYMVQVLYDYQQQLDIPAYTAAWKTALDRYPILRTAFDWQEGTIQVVYKNGLLKYTLHDLSQLSPSERDERIEEILATDRAQAFDLASPTLLRLMIIKQSDNLYTVIKTEHHAIMDGWSGNVLLTFVHQQYQLIKEGKHVPSSEDSSYLLAQQYIQEQRQWADAYWEKALANLDEANDISPLLSRPADLDNYRQVELSAESRIAIPAELLRKVKNLCAKEGLTINVVVQFLWHKILQVYSGSDRTLVGTTVSGRELPVEGIEQSVGLYINTLPLAIAWDNESTVTEQMRQIQQQVTELNTHSFTNLAKIQKHGQRLFHTLFVFENYPETEDKESVLQAKLRRYVEKLDYPIAVVPFEKGHELIIQLQYDQAYLDEPAAEDILNTFQHLLEQVIADPSRKHSSISLLKAEEYDLLLQDFGGALQPAPQNETLHAVFSAHAKRCPEQIALIFAENQLSYRELDQKSNCLARTIREKYVQLSGQALSPDTLIPICMDRGTEMITAILAVLKAGAAYVPIDPAYPQHRIDYILADTNAQIVLSQKHITQAYPILLPEEKIVLPQNHSPQSTDPLPEYSTPESLAYVIYTSGTTGKPKG
ncbi:hypothetical protein DBR43_26515, partial [Pedobacter sp. KBW06]|uniref:non-ribosomal peptide synthetase n=1 Tax=Pedobacter sp. KBW06 TaxID=2153359 RepID=UPI000F5A69CE